MPPQTWDDLVNRAALDQFPGITLKRFRAMTKMRRDGKPLQEIADRFIVGRDPNKVLETLQKLEKYEQDADEFMDAIKDMDQRQIIDYAHSKEFDYVAGVQQFLRMLDDDYSAMSLWNSADPEQETYSLELFVTQWTTKVSEALDALKVWYMEYCEKTET